MNRRSNKKYLIILIILLLGITIGYAAINTTLNINGKSNIQKNSWDIHFENVQTKEGSIEAVKIPTIENNTTVNFEVKLNLPGDFYEFTVDVVNNGTIDAMIDNIEKTPDLSTEQQKYLNYIIEYENKEQITTKQLVKASEFVRLKVRVEYKKDITASDIPQSTEILNLRFTVNYVQSNDSGITVTDNGVYYPIKVISGNYNTVGSEIAIGDEHFYVISSDEDSVTMLTKYNLYVGNECTSDSSSSCTPYGAEATGIQDKNMEGIKVNQSIYKGTIAFSSTNYWWYQGIGYDSYIKPEYGSNFPVYVYDLNSALYEHVEKYKTYLSTQGVTPIDARLITYEELDNLGCEINYCDNAPSWVYSTSYWTGSANSSISAWYVLSTGNLSTNTLSTDYYFGCRPVIVISKDDINSPTRQLIKITISGTAYQAEEGMTWEEWVDSEYNIDNFFITNNYIFAFKDAYLTSDSFTSVDPNETINPKISYEIKDKSSNPI